MVNQSTLKDLGKERFSVKIEIHKAYKYRFLLLLLLPGLAYFIIFKYGPLYGLILSIKDLDAHAGIMASPIAQPWNKHFARIFSNTSGIMQVTFNTVRISLLKLIFGFPAPIILALLINEISNEKFKRVTQTISYMPYFLSWVVVASLTTSLLSPSTGVVGIIYRMFSSSGNPPILLTQSGSFLAILVITDIWKNVGYGSVLYLASIAGINQEMYEAAIIDGAGRFKRMIYITLPSISPTIVIMLIMNLGGIMNSNFDQIYNLYNPLVYSVADVISTYIYRIGLGKYEYSFTTAIGLLQNLISFGLVLGGNAIARKFSEYALW